MTQEKRINSFPNFKLTVNDMKVKPTDIHLLALFSANKDALPLLSLHRWSGSFLNFLPLLDLLRSKYTPGTLPYHVIVPSLPHYGLRRSSGYRTHLNMLAPRSPYEILDQENLTQAEVEHVQRMYDFSVTGSSSILEQGLRPSTICFVLLSSSFAKLARIGEKFIEWSDSRYPLPLDTALALVGFYWYTKTYPRSLYLYHYIAEAEASDVLFAVPTSREKSFGYSVFPAENILVPEAGAKQVYPDLAFYERNEKQSRVRQPG
ncbi:epoxide hydrolase [Colletotrichum higginsianum]|uniref:Epoxide hydrolase n=1 Tax=Colletotrichum higginsianum (strain IMI 349063) TaxID=759273 RepID=H1VB21_COLHI|nr:epoxide hydrolase [Colletotrichum higginsianum]